ncbi:hypothetical protein CSV63_07770 [Sporosarcina sp. P34]|uniref:dienelactone hydrolase family protein n=1 Tax=Sporosarcina sp. P34 TaxID=2048247 RepID=UPI000C16758A|nr:dienelactone hydrolase family protein [Sporosarcina sp. P34]PID15665.1 hypothetical protein CSV63_07770 [Sporosarcina sp. P34]
MSQTKSTSETCIIVLHEIYGINQFMNDICVSLSEKDFDVICPNLLTQETPFDYSQEEVAYENFMQHDSFENNARKVKELVVEMKDQYAKVFILGFSVGATIAWLCSEEKCVDGMVGYYGSRIRDYAGMNPACPTLLYFPNTEKSFNVNEMVVKLEKPNVEVYLYDGQHGFSDPYAFAYNEELAHITFKQTIDFFRNNCIGGSTS